jgi:hypothetical protein
MKPRSAWTSCNTPSDAVRHIGSSLLSRWGPVFLPQRPSSLRRRSQNPLKGRLKKRPTSQIPDHRGGARDILSSRLYRQCLGLALFKNRQLQRKWNCFYPKCYSAGIEAGVAASFGTPRDWIGGWSRFNSWRKRACGCGGNDPYSELSQGL